MGKKYVPVHRHSVWYYFGGVTLFLFIIQVVTGILLLLYYKGSEQLAFESIQFIMSKVAVRLADPLHPQLGGEPLHPLPRSSTCSASSSSGPTATRARSPG